MKYKLGKHLFDNDKKQKETVKIAIQSQLIQSQCCKKQEHLKR